MQAGFILNPSGRVHIKEQCSQYLLMAYPQIGKQSGILAPPIELAVFQAKEPMEATIIRWMHRIISNQRHFLVPMEQVFDTNGKRLQARIQDKSAFQQLAKQLKVVSQYICSYDCPEMIFSIQPHVQVSKTIADPAYHLLLAAKQTQSFVVSFEIRELLLLKKHHDFDSYKPMNVFALRP
jgi:hypothetical protein